jgi:hypothetical protein
MMRPQELERRCAEMRARHEPKPCTAELHARPLTAQQAAERSGMSVDWIRRHFSRVPGTILIPSRSRRGVRTYHRISIPEDVFLREMSRFVVRAA